MKKLFFIALILCAVSFAQTNVARMLSGVNAQTGTSYTFVASDVTKIVTFNNANPVGATLPVGTTSGFGTGSVFTIVDLGVGTVTITCSGCTINGAASVQVVQNSSVSLYGDGTNYISAAGGGGGGGSSISGSTALGTQVGGNGAGGFASTSKPILDPRDFGVDCSGSSDSSTALNTLFTVISQRQVNFPQDCQVRADHQIVIQSQSGWVIKGLGDRPGAGGFGGPSIYGCNGSAGAVLYINRSGYGTVEGLGIYAKGPTGVCASSSFTQSVQIDSTGNPGVTTHNIVLDHLALTTSPVGGAITNYVGLSITDGGKQNGEQIRISNSWIHCQNSSGSIGVLNNNFTSDNDLVDYNHIVSCKYGIQNNGNTRIVGNLLSSNGDNSVFGTFGAAIYTPQCSSGQMSILYNEVDSSGPFIDNGHTGAQSCSAGFNITGNAVGVSDIASGEYIIDVGAGGGSWNLQSNTFTVTQNTSQYIIGSQAQPALKGPLGSLYEFGNNLKTPTLSNVLGWEDLTRPFQNGETRSSTSLGTDGLFGPNGSASDFSNFSHVYFPNLIGNNLAQQSPFLGMRAWTGAANDDWWLQSIANSTSSALTFNHNAGPATTNWFNWDGQINGLKIAALSTPAAPTGVTPAGTPGGTTYTYAIVAYGQSGNTAGSSTLSTSTGNASLSSTNYNLIQFTPTASIGANKWCVWRTVGGATQGKIGCVNAVATVANSQNADTYFLNDTGLTGDASALPTINTTGKIITAASTTGAAGLNLPHGSAPTTPINGDIWTTTAGLFAQVNGGTVGPMSAGGGGGLSGMTTLGMPIATSPTNIATSTTPGTNQGTYIFGRFNSVQGVATSPIEIQAGDCSAPGVISGASTTYTIIYTDVIGCEVTHDIAATQSATITIPNPATLNNPAPKFVYSNYSTHADTLTPSTYQISMGGAAAGASLSVPSNVSCNIHLDYVNGATYKAECYPMSTSPPTVTFSGNTTTAVSAGTGVNSAVTGTTLIADGSGNAIPLPKITTVGLGGVWTNGMPLGIPVTIGTVATPVNTTMYVQQFTLQGQQTIGNATFDATTCTSCAEVVNTCLYDSTAATLLWSGISATFNGTGAFSATGTQATIQKGVYYFAYAFSGTTPPSVQGYSGGAGATDNILNKNGTRIATAANGISGGLCPASLGVLTPSTGTAAHVAWGLEP